MSKDRIYDTGMVHLPALTASSTLTLARQLQTRAKAWASEGKTLPELVQYAVDQLSGAIDVLGTALQPTVSADGMAARQADNALDAAWGSLRTWLSGFVALGQQKLPGLDAAIALYELLFADGLTFTQLSFKEEHAQSQARLDAIVAGGHEATFAALGGTLFYETVKSAHEAYGQVLGISQAVDAQPAAELRAPRATVQAAMRDLVIKVVAQVRADKPETSTLPDDLLLPLIEWADQTTGNSSSTSTAEASSGSAPAAE